MLTSDLVPARRRGGKLILKTLDDKTRPLALSLAERYLRLAKEHMGKSQAEFRSQCAAIEAPPVHKRLSDGLLKLVTDRCTFQMEEGINPQELRHQVFTLAAATRRSLVAGQDFDRNAILAEAAKTLSTSVDSVEDRLFADLKKAHKLIEFKSINAQALLDIYDVALVQAVLLKALKVRVHVQASHPGAYRALFNKLKFLRLMHTIEEQKNGYLITVDGPFSLFRQVTKYGLQLALMIPALNDCGAWQLRAELLWGKTRDRLEFNWQNPGPTDPPKGSASLSDDCKTLVKRFRKLDSEWTVRPSRRILSLPGEGLVVPDLVFKHKKSATTVYFEVLGFWSRPAVWRRVELVEAGLPHNIIFAVTERLRVSDEVLPKDLPGSLYVYKGVMLAKRVLEQLKRHIPEQA